MKTIYVLSAITAITVVTAIATAPAVPNTTFWENVPGWQIRYDPTTFGCYLATVYADGMVFRVERSQEKGLILLVANSKWRLVNERPYHLTFHFGRAEPWQARTIADNDVLAFGTRDPAKGQALLGDLTGQSNLRLYDHQTHRQIGDYLLRNIATAVHAMEECHALGGLPKSIY